MRTIKFRAFIPSQNKTFSAEQMAADQMTLLPTGQFINVHSADTRLSEIIPVERMIPMQFTGLFDKEGVEIYQGDVIGWFRPDVGSPVEFRYGAFGIDAGGWMPLGAHTSSFALVLGNIYQHPELIDQP